MLQIPHPRRESVLSHVYDWFLGTPAMPEQKHASEQNADETGKPPAGTTDPAGGLRKQLGPGRGHTLFFIA